MHIVSCTPMALEAILAFLDPSGWLRYAPEPNSPPEYKLVSKIRRAQRTCLLKSEHVNLFFPVEEEDLYTVFCNAGGRVIESLAHFARLPEGEEVAEVVESRPQ